MILLRNGIIHVWAPSDEEEIIFKKLMEKYEAMKLQDKKGFTLIELAVVIAIIAILALVMVPAISKYIAKSEISKVETNLRSVYTSAQVVNQTEIEVGEEGYEEEVAEYANIGAGEVDKYSYSEEDGVLTVTYTGKITKSFDGTDFTPAAGLDE